MGWFLTLIIIAALASALMYNVNELGRIAADVKAIKSVVLESKEKSVK